MFLLSALVTAFVAPASAQVAAWAWGLQSSNPSPADRSGAGGKAVATDANGAVYVGGSLRPVFQPGPGAIRHFGAVGSVSGPGGFVVKATAAGSWAWTVAVAPLGTDAIGETDAQVTALAVTPAGDVYAAGTVAADTLRVGGITLDLPARHTLWFARLNSAGTCQWLRTSDAGRIGPNLALDPSTGGVVVAGTYAGSPTFGTIALPPSYTSLGQGAVFVARLSAAGQWTAAVGSTGSTGLSIAQSPAVALAVGPAGQVAVGGQQPIGSITFGSITTTIPFSCNGGFVVAQLSPANQWQWASSSTTGVDSRIFSLAYAPTGSLWVGGVGSGGTTVGPLVISSPAPNVPASFPFSFIGQLSAAGQWLLAQQPPLGPTYLSSVSAFAVDGNGSAVVLGGLGSLGTGPVPASIGGQVVTAPAVGYQPFIATLNPGGQWRYVTTVPLSTIPYGLYPFGLALDGGTSLYLTGTIQGAATFGGSSLVGSYDGSPTAAYGSDLFLARLTNATALAARPAAIAPALACYPNPARTTATLRLPAPAEATTATLFDALGRPARTYALPAHATAATLDLASLAPGLYVVRCGPATGRLVVE